MTRYCRKRLGSAPSSDEGELLVICSCASDYCVVEDYFPPPATPATARLQEDQIMADRAEPEPGTPLTITGETNKDEALKSGQKWDAGKLRFTLLDPTYVWGTIRVLEFGAQKYHVNNWRRGMDFSRPYNALQRHLDAWFNKREELDPETGEHHLDHASCCLMFLRGYAANPCLYSKFDDRQLSFEMPGETERPK
jgi:Domain of unknown function (DUF5664)